MSLPSFYQNLIDESLICGRCGNCRNDCPVYREIGWESATPRAKISLARELFARNSQGGISPEYAKRVTQCTLCGACTRACAARIDLQSLWKDLRSRLVAEGKAPAAYQAMTDNLKSRKNISSFDNVTRLDWAEDLDEIPDSLDQEPGAEVAYFVGCVSSFFPRAAQIPVAMVQLLQKAQVNFTTLGSEEWCCGFPLLAAGQAAAITEFARHNVAKIREMGVKTLVTGCASCYHVWSHIYPEILGEDLGFRLVHATELLAELIAQGKLVPQELKETVTYHDPCDLGRNSGVVQIPRTIINSIPGITFVEMATHGEESTCCGGGGNLQGADPGLADAIACKRIREAAATGAAIVVSACQQCEQMLEKAARTEKLPLTVMDIAELLLMAVEE
ncbi:(Fe-S)-binding protein [Sporomusa acidovorans]|uniref:Iron-sulfur-binding oxidoreductase FadF n=1 Tax=Sporomusa acidovorans (strain ATCC 49682 / DSM 3132 / Mol) TaxID=1123286 RepID=A0ABZ3J555_SPOA4|nr:(Fe-S)-binding protein [Sporomusa acidovorans]OZC15643.1 anaerobic glycerol-3-phosphate dehydrogenase subunit C [Sporomusa acidovorans DSM 3132]SDE88065.1 CoB-CoM heterodisulfide reductase, subunit D [Sporomusa acidovorans]